MTPGLPLLAIAWLNVVLAAVSIAQQAPWAAAINLGWAIVDRLLSHLFDRLYNRWKGRAL